MFLWGAVPFTVFMRMLRLAFPSAIVVANQRANSSIQFFVSICLGQVVRLFRFRMVFIEHCAFSVQFWRVCRDSNTRIQTSDCEGCTFPDSTPGCRKHGRWGPPSCLPFCSGRVPWFFCLELSQAAIGDPDREFTLDL